MVATKAVGSRFILRVSIFLLSLLYVTVSKLPFLARIPAPTLGSVCPKGDPTLSVSNVFSGPSVVLQCSPSISKVWGWVHPLCTVRATLSKAGGGSVSFPVVELKPEGLFVLSIAPHPCSQDEYVLNIASESRGANVSLGTIRFGLVYACIGQSNMVGLNTWTGMESDSGVKMSLTMESESVRHDSLKALPIFGLRVGMQDAWAKDSPLLELASPPLLPWTALPNAPAAADFSAVCWWMGRGIAAGLQGETPVGLIESAWAGSWIQAWSSTRALEKCQAPPFGVSWAPGHPSSLYNAMVRPFAPFAGVAMATAGVSFYQGESNALTQQAEYYACALRELIEDWLQEFSTEKGLFFGVVELAPFASAGQWGDGFPSVRVAQGISVRSYRSSSSSNKSSVASGGENSVVLVPTGDVRDPGGDIHPRLKKKIGDRLGQAALASYLDMPLPQGPSFLRFSWEEGTDRGGGGGFLHLWANIPLAVKEDEGFCEGVEGAACCGIDILRAGTTWEAYNARFEIGTEPNSLKLEVKPGGRVIAVRGGYCMWPQASIFSKNTFAWPAHPFVLSSENS